MSAAMRRHPGGRLQKVQVCQNEHLVLSEQCSRQGLSCAFFNSFMLETWKSPSLVQVILFRGTVMP